MILFNGKSYAQQKLQNLREKLKQLNLVRKPKITAILFNEDAGSLLYTEKKQQAAQFVGIDYQVKNFSIKTDLSQVEQTISQFNQDVAVTGIIIQKPWQKTFFTHFPEADKNDYQGWWQSLVKMLDPKKDVDGLHPNSLKAIKNNNWSQQGLVLPATCQAVWEIIQQIPAWKSGQLQQGKIIIIGRSDLLGKPLFYLLKKQGLNVEMIGKKELADRQTKQIYLTDADLIVSSTGQAGLITGKMIKTDAALIDVGEPKPDIDFASAQAKASFITPVPGGVGPVTVACLMENGVKIFQNLSNN